jgi:tetratricopeptide (TPR) repeat protein
LPALRANFGTDRIFLDIDNIPPGEDFLKFIRSELASCSVLLAIIGREWLTIQDPRLNKRRLDNPHDFLRVEVSTALKSERIRVIPVLVERGRMPSAEDLPPDLAELAFRNAVELSDGRWESDVKRLIDAIKQAVAAPAAAEVPVGRPELQELQKRRAREIAAQLQNATAAFEAHDYELTLRACDRVLLLDPTNSEALELLDRSRKAIDEQKITGWLRDARQALDAGDIATASDVIDQALSFDPALEPALTLRKELLNVRRERERIRERSRHVKAAIERAQASLDEEDFDAAVRYADEAVEMDPQSAEAQEVRATAVSALEERRRQREHRRRAQQAVASARVEFAAGEHDAALRMLREFSPPHDLVTQALEEMQRHADAAAAERAAAATEEARQAADAAAERARREAEAAAAARAARAAAESRQAAERARREADLQLTQASEKLQEGDHAAARRLIDAARGLVADHPDIAPLLRRVEQAEDRQAAEVRRVEALRQTLGQAKESLAKGELEATIRHADAALAIDPALEDAKALKEQAHAALEEGRARDAHDRAARQIVERALRLFDGEEHQSAVDLLEGFSPPHARVSRALDELRPKMQQIERRRREQQETAARLEQERLAREAAERERAEAARLAEKKRKADAEARAREDAERRQKALAAAIAAIETSLSAGRLDDADRLIAEAEETLPGDPGLAALEQRAKQLRDQQEQRAREARVQQLLANGQAAFAAREFRSAKRKASEVLGLVPDHEAALTLRAAAARELRAAAAPYWRMAGRAAIAAAAAVILAVAGWRLYGVVTKDATPASEATQDATPPPLTRPADPTAGTAAVEPPPEVTAPPPAKTDTPASADAMVERVNLLRETARAQYRRGQGAQAIDTAVEGLKIDPKDGGLQKIVNSLLSDAQSAAQRARDAAVKAGAGSLAAFAEGRRLENEAARSRDANRNDAAIRSLWKAADRFEAAGQQATAAAEEQARQQRLAEEQRQKQPPADEPSRERARPTDQPRPKEETKVAENRPVVPLPADPPPSTPPRTQGVNRAEEEGRVRAVLQRYEAAYDRLEIGTLKAVFPSMSRELERGLAKFRSYDMELRVQKIDLSPDATSAVATCDVRHEFVGDAGGTQKFQDTRIITLRKQGTSWIIETINYQRR